MKPASPAFVAGFGTMFLFALVCVFLCPITPFKLIFGFEAGVALFGTILAWRG